MLAPLLEKLTHHGDFQHKESVMWSFDDFIFVSLKKQRSIRVTCDLRRRDAHVTTCNEIAKQPISRI